MKKMILTVGVAVILVLALTAAMLKTQKLVMELQGRIDRVEEHERLVLSDVSSNLSEIGGMCRTTMANQEDAIKALKESMRWNDDVAAQLNDFLKSSTNKPATRSAVNYYVPAKPAQQAFVNGVPNYVYQSIRTAAEQKWPNEYNMQVYEIRQQVEAYKKLHP